MAIQKWLVIVCLCLSGVFGNMTNPFMPASTLAASNEPVTNPSNTASPQAITVARNTAATPAHADVGSPQTNDKDADPIASALKSALPLLVITIACILFYKEWRRDSLVIEPFDVPKDLQDLGLTGSVVSQILSDCIYELLRSARVDDDAFDILFVELPKLQVDLQLPGVAWSARSVIRYLKQAWGLPEKRLLGEVVRKRKTYSIRLRTASGRAGDVPIGFHSSADIDVALKATAEMAILLLDSFEAASIHYSRETVATGYAKTVDALKFHLATAPARTHQDTYVLWASVHRVLGQFDAMEEKLKLAENIRPRYWRCRFTGGFGSRYLNFVGNLYREKLLFQQSERMFMLAMRADPGNVGAMSNLGLLYLDQWRLDDASRCFRRVVTQRPNSSRGHRGLGLVAMKSRRLNEALQFFTRAIDVTPSARWPKVNLIETLRLKGDYPAALAAIEDFRANNRPFSPFFRFWGGVLRDLSEFDAALAKYNEAIAVDPYDPWGYSGQSDILRRLGRIDEAIASANKALQLRPNLNGPLWNLVAAHRDKGDLEGALSASKALLAAAPFEPYAHASLIDDYRKLGRFAEARENLFQAPVRFRNTPDLLRAEGWLYFDQGDPESAVKCFEKAIDEAPQDIWAYWGKIACLQRLGRLDEASKEANEACTLRPHMPDSWRHFGRVLLALYDIPGAEAKFRKSIELSPNDPWGYLALSEALSRRDAHDDAMAHAEKALALRPNLAEALRRLGEVRRDKGDFDGAEVKFREAIEANPADPWGYLALSNVLLRRAAYDDATAFAEKALTLRPNWAEALRGLAEIRRDQDDFDGAEVKFREAIEANPTDPRGHVALASFFRYCGNDKAAESSLEQALTLRPNYPDALWQFGAIKSESNDLDVAEEKLRLAAETAPNCARGHAALADVLLRLERFSDAVSSAERALNLQPGMQKALRILDAAQAKLRIQAST